MELLFRTLFHNLQKFLIYTTGFTNENIYLMNLKRIEAIIQNDYRTFIGEEFSAESEGSCSMASGSIRGDEDDERTDEFEFPGGNEEERGDGSNSDSEAESDEHQN